MKKQKYLLVYILIFLLIGSMITVILNLNGISPFGPSENPIKDGEELLINLLDNNSAIPSNNVSPILVVEEKQNRAKLVKSCLSGKDCIPSIDKPKFTNVLEADSYLVEGDMVVGLDRSGEFRAYPLKILNWHEIVNDMVAKEPVVVTFCPFSYSVNVFSRLVEEDSYEFGVSGYLFENNLVIYDRGTGSLWSQLTGEAITGSKIGMKLIKLDSSIISWGVWKKNHPDTKVLSTDTGYIRDYELFPYDDKDTFENKLIKAEEKSAEILN